MRWAWAAAVALCVVGCGSSRGGGRAPELDDAGAGDAGGSPVTDAGTGGGGGDGGSDAGPGTVDGGTGGGGGTTDGGTMLGCAALVAPNPLPSSHVYQGPDLTQAYGVCNPGWIGFDRNGFIGFAGLREVYDPDKGPLVSGVDLSILSPAGSTVAKQSFPNFSDRVGPFIQPGGAGIVAQDSSAESTLITVDESGSFRRRAVGRVPWYAVDALASGGTVEVEGGFFAFADGGTVREPQTVTRRDENLDTIWSWALGDRASPTDTVVALANTKGNVLVLVVHLVDPHTTTTKGYWLDGAGQLVRSFDVPPPGFSWRTVAKLVDGALAFRDDGIDLILRPWVEYIPDLKDPAPVPDWLSTRPETRVAVIRGGRGYVVLHDKFANPSAPFPVEVVTLEGRSCATYDPSCSTNGGNPCPDNVFWNVGLDGTLFAATTAGVPEHCVAEAWPALFK